MEVFVRGPGKCRILVQLKLSLLVVLRAIRRSTRSALSASASPQLSYKKGAANPKDEIAYSVKDVVLGKIRGFPAWPAQVVDPDSIPREVARERPSMKKQIFYCIRFFPAGDYAWALPKDLSKLKKHEIEAYIAEPHKKNFDLLKGYRIALNPEGWENEMEKKRADAEEAEEAEEVDELDGEEEVDEEEEKPAKAKKRKRESEAAAKPKKPKKEKEPSEPTTKKKKAAAEKADKPAKPRKNGAKSKALVESEDEGERAVDAGSSKKVSPPPAKKNKRDKDDDGDPEMENDPEAIKVKDMRHKLQRAFLGKGVPKDDDMPALDVLFNQVEEFDMTIKYLQHSKIGKVMRHIAALEPPKVPRDDEFKFKDRAQALVNKWHTTINKVNGSAEPKATDVEKSVLNDAIPLSAATDAGKNDADGEAEAEAEGEKVEEDVPGVGDMTIGESALGDVTMSEAA
ncbi:Tudor/PWWP/MBT [Phellopilus nigrolimitatus]|nr:Tudor/PWWP/MBT [Phellopilus nigrolimitatus]